MTRVFASVARAVVSLVVVSILIAAAGRAAPRNVTFTEDARRAAIQKARVWTPTNISSMDLRLGPQGHGSFLPNALVACDYVEEHLSGHTRKFSCMIGPGDVVKVRYGKTNGHVQGAVLATRLLWALGFGADRVYTVRVSCRGCSSDPWNRREKTNGVRVFEPAVIERKPSGDAIATGKHEGWAWPELDLVDETRGGAPREQREALTLLAAFMQHTDSKSDQQRLLCLPGGLAGDQSCDTPFMFIHDVGLTFGRANKFNDDTTAAVNFEGWAQTPIWRDVATCTAHLSKSATGTLGDPRIGEGGRKFLGDLLLQLTDRQLHDLFAVARVDLRVRRRGEGKAPETVNQWVDVFKHKRDEIVSARCQA